MTKLEKLLIGAGIVILCIASFIGGQVLNVKAPTFGNAYGLYTPTYNDTYFASTSASTSVGTLIDAFPGLLHTISIETPLTGSIIAIYDTNSSTVQVGTTTLIAKFTITTSSPFSVILDTSFANGLVVDQTAATSTMTFSWK
jgi:hypothetical protein